jgi:hypothetical protein
LAASPETTALAKAWTDPILPIGVAHSVSQDFGHEKIIAEWRAVVVHRVDPLAKTRQTKFPTQKKEKIGPPGEN